MASPAVQGHAQGPVAEDAIGRDGPTMNADRARQTVQSLVDMAIGMLPHHHDGEKNWGKTKKLWAGVRFRRDGLRVSTKRRWREVRHGLQTRYRVSFPGPEASRPPVIAKVRSVNYSAGDENHQAGWVIECELTTPLDFSARIERWNLGVQWYSVEVSGHMNIGMTIDGRLASVPDYTVLPPAIIIDPSVTAASLRLEAFHVDRVSKIGGDVAEAWGEVAKKVVEEILLDDFNAKLPTKLNKAIDKKRDKLRFSASEWIAGLTASKN